MRVRVCRKHENEQIWRSREVQSLESAVVRIVTFRERGYEVKIEVFRDRKEGGEGKWEKI